MATIGYGIVLVLGAWLTGPTRAATAIRRAAAPYMREPVLAYGGFAVVVAIVVFWWSPTPATRNPVLAVLLVVLLALGFEAARRQTVKEFPDANRDEARERRRERLARILGPLRAGAGSTADAVGRKFSAVTAGAAGTGSAPGGADSRLDSLERLAQLQAAGLLDPAEVENEKARILAPAAGTAGDSGAFTPSP